MPISLFFGIVIRMYHTDHPPAHFHASYQGFEAFIEIATGNILAGSLPKKAARLVRQWALDHQSWSGSTPQGISSSISPSVMVRPVAGRPRISSRAIPF
jgi:hypothetical protein